ncbi:hypothetical protein [Aliikangiella sp. IMCC44359]|uniref:hypothetical protein n=1 Tax=Aliikangiella sp. IMCC44359 TaxID=3459125 RepID=UPI00403B3492
MKTISLTQSIFIGLCLSIVGAVGFQTMSWVLPEGDVLQIILSTINFVYIAYLLFNSSHKTGRLSCLILYSTANIILLLAFISHEILLIFLCSSIWLARSIFFQKNLLASIIDALLILIGYSVALWTLSTTHSWFLTLWCFYLIQTLFIYIPQLTRIKKKQDNSLPDNQAFQIAYKNATNAIKRIENH